MNECADDAWDESSDDSERIPEHSNRRGCRAGFDCGGILSLQHRIRAKLEIAAAHNYGERAVVWCFAGVMRQQTGDS